MESRLRVEIPFGGCGADSSSQCGPRQAPELDQPYPTTDETKRTLSESCRPLLDELIHDLGEFYLAGRFDVATKSISAG